MYIGIPVLLPRWLCIISLHRYGRFFNGAGIGVHPSQRFDITSHGVFTSPGGK